LGYASGGYDMAEYVKGDVVLTPYPLSGEKVSRLTLFFGFLR
jgi:hypothetical protein